MANKYGIGFMALDKIVYAIERIASVIETRAADRAMIECQKRSEPEVERVEGIMCSLCGHVRGYVMDDNHKAVRHVHCRCKLEIGRQEE